MSLISVNDHLHMLFLPFPTLSHMHPMISFIKLVASHGVNCTVITTSANAYLFPTSFITTHLIPFPATEFGIPAGVENMTIATSPDMKKNVFMALVSLQKPMEELIQHISPDCIISDMYFPWSVDLASKLGVPRLLFHGCCIFTLCCEYYVMKNMHVKDDDNDQVVTFPLFPDKIEMKFTQLPDWVQKRSGYTLLKEVIKKAELKSYGIIANTFESNEPGYIDHYRETTGLKIWPVGPILYKPDQCNNDENGHPCIEWLDQKKPKSVVYVCFGSLMKFGASQLREIGAGLEASGHDFIWAAKRREKEEEDWLSEGFMERIKESKKGFIIKEWAPQILILNHKAIGGMVTHCGYNSIIEGVNAGVPLVTWPMFAEQFYNERLLVDVLKVAVPVEGTIWRNLDNDDDSKEDMVIIGRDKLEEAVRRLMTGDEAAEKRERVVELGCTATRVVQDGGQSTLALMELLHELKTKRSMFVKPMDS